MIGTIIIAVIGYGLSLVCSAGMVACACIFFTSQKNDHDEDLGFKGFFLFLVGAIAAAAITRALAGGW